MHYLIDGHNLIARLEDLALDDPDDEAKLVLRLRSWTAASKKRRVTVIFDSGLPGGKSRRLSTSRVTVLFATSGQTADDLLIRRINQLQDPAAFTLVSSDRAVIAAAHKRRMPVLLAEKFASQLPGERPQAPIPRGETDEQKPAIARRETPELSEDEINEWLELFGPAPERKPPTSPKPPEPTDNKPSTSSPASPTIPTTPTTPTTPTKHSIGRVDRERSLSAAEIEEWVRLFNQNRD
jgi:hypothetical protein